MINSEETTKDMKRPNDISSQNFRKFRSVSEEEVRNRKTFMSKAFIDPEKRQSMHNVKSIRCSTNKSEIVIGSKAPFMEKPSDEEQYCTEIALIPSPKNLKQPKEVLRRSLIRLKSSQWRDSLIALGDIIQISRFHPQLLDKSMNHIYRAITALLKGVRVTAARSACQTANELLMNVQPIEGNDFEEMIHALLHKTIENNRDLVRDASEALDTMVVHIPPILSVKILLQKRINSYNIRIRAKAAKLLVCVVNILGTDTSIQVSEEMKTLLIQGTLRYLQDNASIIKFHGLRLATMLTQQKDFEEMLHKRDSNQLLESIKSWKSTKADDSGSEN